MQSTESQENSSKMKLHCIPRLMAEAAARCLRDNVTFALYRLPGKECVFLSNPGLTDKTDDERRLRISMWNETYANGIIIKNELDAEETISYLNSEEHKPRKQAEIFPWPMSTSRLQYEGQLRKVIANLRKRGGKTVISRVVAENHFFTPEGWLEIADKLFGDNASAMCSLYFTNETGAWLCASPELLLDADLNNGMLHTVALAGTRLPQNDTDTAWSAKDVKEHDIVKEYIASRLTALGSKLNISETKACLAGTVEHLKTYFEGSIPDGITPENILDSINPTPALCGYPTDLALKEIGDTEVHPRYCYGGYISVETTDRVQAFVNIRCVHFNKEHMALYAGSGIMPDSTPQSEWDETGAKLETLFRCLGLVQEA